MYDNLNTDEEVIEVLANENIDESFPIVEDPVAEVEVFLEEEAEVSLEELPEAPVEEEIEESEFIDEVNDVVLEEIV